MARAAIILIFFLLLAVSAATGFPENYFDDPMPRGLRALEWIVTTFGTAPFGKTGGAVVFASIGILITWGAALAKDGETVWAMLARRRVEAGQGKKAKQSPGRDARDTSDRSSSGFGRKRAIGNASASGSVNSIPGEDVSRHSPEPSEAYIPDTISVILEEDVAWLKSQSNPAIWHEAASSCVVFLGDPHGFLPWLIKQPNLDRTTAGLIFLGVGGQRYLKNPKEYHSKVKHEEMGQILNALCIRSERIGFAQDSIGFEDDIWSTYEDWRQDCLNLIGTGNIPDNVIVPRAIIEAPFPPRTIKSDYIDIGEGELVTEKWLAETLPHIYGKNGTMPLS